MLTTVVRLVIAGWILVTLVRAGRAAWSQRALVVAIWRAWRPYHLLGVVGLFLVVATVAGVLLTWVPFMDLGLGTLVGTDSNAVFAPLEQAVAATPAPTSGPDWPLILLSSGFLLPLLFLLPWLAFVEEEVFRGGLETADLPRELLSALVFGLAHLIMLVPVGATLAIGVAGFVYGRIYRRAHAVGVTPPPAVRRAYRPSRRARRALEATAPTPATGPTADAVATVATLDAAVRAHDRQAGAVFRATVWHAAFNSAVVAAVWLSIVVAGFQS